MASYAFNRNILRASYSTDLDTAKQEWRIIYKIILPTQCATCICQRKIKDVTYLFNIRTHHTILAGSRCCKTFDMPTEVINNTYIKILCDYLQNGEYTIINNIIQYSNEVQATLIQHIETLYNKYNTNESIIDLKNLKYDIDELETLYKITYLNHIKDLIVSAIDTINQRIREKRENDQRLLTEAEEKARIERGRTELEYIESVREAARLRIEQEKLESIDRERSLNAEKERKALELREKEIEKQEKERQKREKEQNASILPELQCRGCSRKFKASDFRGNNCCSLECLWKNS